MRSAKHPTPELTNLMNEVQHRLHRTVYVLLRTTTTVGEETCFRPEIEIRSRAYKFVCLHMFIAGDASSIFSFLLILRS